MGDVIDFESKQKVEDDDMSIEAAALMEEVFDACTDSTLDPEEVCWLMVSTFGNSMFYGMCREHAIEQFCKAFMAVISYNEVDEKEMFRVLAGVK